LLIGASIRDTVRKAVRLAVYEEIKMRTKNHQRMATSRVDIALGMMSQPVGTGYIKQVS